MLLATILAVPPVKAARGTTNPAISSPVRILTIPNMGQGVELAVPV